MSRFEDPDCPCPFCGHTKFWAGKLESQYKVSFKPDGVPFSQRLFDSGSAEVKARICLNCRHIDLFAPDFEPFE